ncbi:protein of unknown function [Paraburkholderia dioscoreae]|uniref:Uncharacterized protein n=1 Tax=Paraburkholderia dioscoreae TaxID=2604047 RepID=A0A5Q4ZBP9_9BURK|nr:protein of unknown function [Paraburkholderia dioscoreae]
MLFALHKNISLTIFCSPGYLVDPLRASLISKVILNRKVRRLLYRSREYDPSSDLRTRIKPAAASYAPDQARG